MDLFFFFFNDTATTEIYTLSLHDALPISGWRTSRGAKASTRTPTHAAPKTNSRGASAAREMAGASIISPSPRREPADRKSTRLNSSHANISYAVFCLKKKNNTSYHQYYLH